MIFDLHIDIAEARMIIYYTRLFIFALLKVPIENLDIQEGSLRAHQRISLLCLIDLGGPSLLEFSKNYPVSWASQEVTFIIYLYVQMSYEPEIQPVAQECFLCIGCLYKARVISLKCLVITDSGAHCTQCFQYPSQ